VVVSTGFRSCRRVICFSLSKHSRFLLLVSSVCVVTVFHFISCPCSVCGQVARSIPAVRLPFFFC
jgi:hypothetical protein